jgi:hypothetical protein
MPDSELQSRPYHPAATQCCEKCVFGSGEHAPFCAAGVTREDFEHWNEAEMLHEAGRLIEAHAMGLPE